MSQVFIPKTIEEACLMLKEAGRTPCAGATNLYVDRYHGQGLDLDIVSLHKLDALKHISLEEDGWHIGSLVTFDQLESYFAGDPVMGALAQAASLVGGPQVRNRGTIGGNIVSASPSADSVPVLMALDAKVRLQSLRGQRDILLEEFMVGVKKTAIASDELLTEILLPKKEGMAFFRKVGSRNALAISICNIAVYGCMDAAGIEDLAIAIGSCAPTCVRAHAVEEALMEHMKKCHKNHINPFTDPSLEACLRENLLQDICPIDDVRASASYRKKVVGNIILQLLKEL